mmetsp:Transcript_14682/g.35435  ORF Transcript_14682/g.35435 Transcript_14682/m.35435 type:complete len:153 (-) Transcript_14682:123-581(-)|eukprot:CAMPEP_0180135160 /NCGR_PEP_ID=MMETSP0986-20121125/10655_1 /TAXON_ID=697907 /ORGANISM="non described non described, Strain CCMP2293" /LENGTH=152 /DNA_ID=CAMNT_0022075785 /DNA_START=49 /DNA_END=507 /DNA_ORIENTATION=+
MKVHAALTGADGVSGEYAAMRWKGSAAKSCLAATPTRRVCFKEGTHAKGPIFAPLVLARLGVGAPQRSTSPMSSRLDLGEQLRLACNRAVRHGEIREQMSYEKTGGSKEHAFEDHLYLAEPTRRSSMTRNNACLDLGALSRQGGSVSPGDMM